MLKRILGETSRFLASAFRSLFRPRDALIERLALRQQLASVCAKPHPRPSTFDRLFWIVLSSLWPNWRSALAFVTPDTVVRWHRAGWRLFWRFKSRPRGRPPITKELRDRIRQLATENPTWGAPRLHGELLKLGYSVAQSTVARYMPSRSYGVGPGSPDWSTFLRLHLPDSVGIDFFDIPTATFDVLRGFVVIDHDHREVLHLAVTKHPTAEWTANQLLEAFGFRDAPRFLFHDRDRIFGSHFKARVEAWDIEEMISAPHSPWQNPFAERVIGSIRRDLLDHVIVLNEHHAVRLLREYQAYYNTSRTHLGLYKETPIARPVQGPDRGATVVSIPVLGGLHHRYERRAAA